MTWARSIALIHVVLPVPARTLHILQTAAAAAFLSAVHVPDLFFSTNLEVGAIPTASSQHNTILHSHRRVADLAAHVTVPSSYSQNLPCTLTVRERLSIYTIYTI